MTCVPLAGVNEHALTPENLGLYLVHILIEMRKL
jgi:hypothetical protein